MKLTAEYKLIPALLSALFLIGAVVRVQASFEPLAVGGRAAGMGEAYTAIVDDVYSLYYNPAGVLQIDRPEIGTYYSQPYVGLTDNSQISRMFIGYAQPLGPMGRKGGLGVSYLSLNLAGLYKEEALGITYGREYKRRTNLGVGVKFLRKQFGTSEFSMNGVNPETGEANKGPDPVLAGDRGKTALGLDVGVQYRLARAYALGAAIRNINSPDMGLDARDPVPAITTVALARRLRSGSLGVEVSNWKGAEQNTRFSLGGEHWFNNGFGLRAGGGVGSRNYSSLSFGASYKLESFQIDYASILPLQGIEGTMGTQQVSLTVRLGKPPVDPIEAQLMKEKEERVRAETEARYAKSERDRLKKQLLQLTEEKTNAQKSREEQSAQQALEEVRTQAQQRARTEAASTQGAQTSFAEYTSALSEYNDKVRQGATLEEKEVMLEKISSRFTRSGIDLSTVKREIKSLQVEKARAKKDYDLSMNFYQRLVQQGASNEERRGMLQRIVQKYKGTGVDIKPAENEMRLLTR